MFKASENNTFSLMGDIFFAFVRNVRLFHVGKGVIVVIVNIREFKIRRLRTTTTVKHATAHD